MSVENYINQYCSYIHEWDAVYEEYAKSVGLSYTGLIVLYEIYEIENCTQKKLGEYCFIPKQTVNAVVTSFYKKRLDYFRGNAAGQAKQDDSPNRKGQKRH